ncbi:SPOR domain-containing protein [Devosia geojensis]|uniref:SPOR domain-containing protein n=1 Tax=Devosia geojensis TaxID=443610 RepID=UPI00128CBC67|nr:SPOR domain-containing protein [Devosia geojensis]
MNDQPEAADDLIAELAKLMAQDAQGDRRDKAPEQQPEETDPAPAAVAASEPPGDVPAAEDAAPASEPFAFRLPGSAAGPTEPIPAPRFDIGQAEPAAPEPVADPVPPAPEPFAFDFGLTPPREPASSPAVEESPIALDEDHDTIGDLIAAELGEEIDAAEDAFNSDAGAEAPEPAIAPTPTVNAAPQAPAVEPRRGDASDGFRIAPVFGLGGRRVEPAPAPVREPTAARAEPGIGQDPIDDIETLIGDAIRVQNQPTEPEFEPEPARGDPVNAAPALRSLATPVLPQTRPAPQPDPEPMSAEATILAAAAATGAQVGWADGRETDFEPTSVEDEPLPPRRRGGMVRAFAGPAIAVVALLAAGIGLYSVLGLGGNDGPAPLLTADAEPAKEVPEPAAEPTAQQSVVFNEISGNSTPAENEQLVSRDQSQASEVASATPAEDASAEGLVNRRVRTVTVRPDGTIVGGEDSVAGAAMLPVDRPNVPAVPGAEQAVASANATEGGAANAGTAAGAAAGAAGATTGAPAADGDDPLAALIATAPGDAAATGGTPATTPITTTPATTATNGNVPTPMPRIERPSAPSTITNVAETAPQAASQPTSSVNAVVQGTLQPVGGQAQAPAQQQAAVTQQASTAPAYVQLSSQRSEEAAQQTAASLQSRFGNLFGGTTLEIQRVDLGERGIYYRVRLPAQSLQNATQICNNVKAGGGDCFTL